MAIVTIKASKATPGKALDYFSSHLYMLIGCFLCAV